MGRSERSHVSTPGPPSPGEVASIFDPGGSIPESPLSCTSHGSNALWPSSHNSSPTITGPVGLFPDECPLVEKHSDSWIFSEMSMEEIVEALCKHGCRDLTDLLSPSECQDLPFSAGGFGNIYRGALCTGQQIAIKCLRPVIHHTTNGHQTLKRAGEELHVWSQCQHPNVHSLLGVAHYRKQLAVVSPWMPRGTLDRFLSLNLLSVADRYNLCYQIAEGVAYLHQMGIVHGDIKAANILVSADHRAVLAEFGNCIIRDHSIQSNSSTEGIDLSIRWTAPEVLEGPGTPTIKGDVYALGMASLNTILEVFTGSEPYAGMKTLAVWRSILSRRLPDRPEKHIPTGDKQADVLWGLLHECWAYNPQARPVATEVQGKMRYLEAKFARKRLA